MVASLERFTVSYSSCVLTRGPVAVDGECINVRFDVQGSGATIGFPKEHVTFFDGDAGIRMESEGGYGGEVGTDSCFFVWQVIRGDAESIHIVYREGNATISEEHVSLDLADRSSVPLAQVSLTFRDA